MPVEVGTLKVILQDSSVPVLVFVSSLIKRFHVPLALPVKADNNIPAPPGALSGLASSWLVGA